MKQNSIKKKVKKHPENVKTQCYLSKLIRQ